jgi:hypothetical protein
MPGTGNRRVYGNVVRADQNTAWESPTPGSGRGPTPPLQEPWKRSHREEPGPIVQRYPPVEGFATAPMEGTGKSQGSERNNRRTIG